MKLLRGQGVARLVHQAAGSLMVVVQIAGCWFNGLNTHQTSPKPATSVEIILHKLDPAIGADTNQLVIEVVVGVMH